MWWAAEVQYLTPQLHGPNDVEIPNKKTWFRLGGV